MRQNCKKRIVDLIKQIKNLEANQKCTDIMLIIDEFTSPLLSSIVVQFFSLGVKNITKVSLKKKPQPKFAGLYFISQQSLSTIAEDFKNGPIYHSINILLCEQITRQIMKKIADEKVIMQRLAFFGELLLNVKFPSNNISMICTQNSLFASSIKGQITIAPQVLSTKIFQALISGFDSNFRLKIYFGNTKYIQKLVEQMSVKYASLTKQKQSEIVQQVKQTQKEHKNLNLLLVDRRSDLISPLIRNFYYMNMISDIFKVDFQKKEVLLRTQRTINFNYDDPIFSQYKYLHISKIPSLVQPDFKEFKTSNKAAQLSQDKGNGNIASMDLKQIIRDIPQFNKKVKSYEQQIQIIDQITQLSKEEKLPQIGQVQQMIISGVGGHGEEIPDKRILERSLEVCNTINDPQKIIRILVLLLFCLNLSQNQKKSVLNRIKSFPKYATLAKLLQEKLPHILPKPAKLKLSSQRERLFLHMHESLVESIMIEILQRQVSKQVSLKILGDQKKKKQSKFQKISKKQQKNWIVCIIGGISFNEIVQLQRLKMRYENLELSFICTEILAGWSYLEKLEKVWSQ